METKQQVHNLIILDESGSMESVKPFIINGFNEIVQTMKGIEKQFPEQEHFISLITFNGLGIKTHLDCAPLEKIQSIDERNYVPDATTPLYDAMGLGIGQLKNKLALIKDPHVLVTILTDGEENASQEFSGRVIKKLVEKLQEQNWTFTYIGTDHDVSKFAHSLNISNAMVYDKSEIGINEMFLKERDARFNYSNNIREKKNLKDKFYGE